MAPKASQSLRRLQQMAGVEVPAGSTSGDQPPNVNSRGFVAALRASSGFLKHFAPRAWLRRRGYGNAAGFE
eukprot:14301211-Alexandrium_andersonii.AAC.1